MDVYVVVGYENDSIRHPDTSIVSSFIVNQLHVTNYGFLASLEMKLTIVIQLRFFKDLGHVLLISAHHLSGLKMV